MPPLRIVYGGQAGVGCAALEVAIALGLPSSGWCPRGRRVEAGPCERKRPGIYGRAVQALKVLLAEDAGTPAEPSDPWRLTRSASQ